MVNAETVAEVIVDSQADESVVARFVKNSNPCEHANQWNGVDPEPSPQADIPQVEEESYDIFIL